MTDGVGDTVRSYLNTINCLFARDQIVDPAMDCLENYYSWVYEQANDAINKLKLVYRSRGGRGGRRERLTVEFFHHKLANVSSLFAVLVVNKAVVC